MLKNLAVFTLFDGVNFCADQLNVVLLENSEFVQCHRSVQCGLTTQRRQNGVGLFFGDDGFDDLRGDRLDIGCVGEIWIGHDCRRVRVDQNHTDALGT